MLSPFMFLEGEMTAQCSSAYLFADSCHLISRCADIRVCLRRQVFFSMRKVLLRTRKFRTPATPKPSLPVGRGRLIIFVLRHCSSRRIHEGGSVGGQVQGVGGKDAQPNKRNI
ncbi:hypothetical protein CDAR_497241 [Caerostris darwini]|uniref:Uncharacterized protein n=1 Tax=Caerostris darwini TaxID=1538125 RepID=A0AAV4S3D7_9ARAC|nr:hypothetical protein CDAR_497241 [Caerostris darwini]